MWTPPADTWSEPLIHDNINLVNLAANSSTYHIIVFMLSNSQTYTFVEVYQVIVYIINNLIR